jgi:photosystem II stability/assembly factor-like uncharacterized protein
MKPHCSFLAIMAAVAVLVLVFLLHQTGVPTYGLTPAEQAEYYALAKVLKHVDPNSREGRTATDRFQELRRRERPRSENPGEFQRILYERTIPYGETVPAYVPGYRTRELRAAIARAPESIAMLPWVERGPFNVSGRARGIVVDPGDPSGNTWFVGSVGGGIWKTTNAGAAWTEVAPYLQNLAVSTIEMSASNNNIMYAGTGESMFNVDVINGDGILKSTDHGASWFPLPATTGNPNFNNIARLLIDPANPNIVLAATTSGRYKQSFSNTSGIWRSADGGGSWTQVHNETTIGGGGRVQKVLQLVATPGNFNVLFGSVDEGGVLKSTNAGTTWFRSSSGLTDTSGRMELAIAPSNPSRIYASSEGSTSRLFVSSDAGATWQLTVASGFNPNWLSSQGWYDNTIVVHPQNEHVVYTGGVSLYRMEMSGLTRTTTTIASGPVHVDHHNLMILPRAGGGFRLLNSNDGGIGLSGDSSANWTKPTDGLNTTQFYGVDKKPGASAYIGGMQDNGTWRSPENSTATDPWTFQIGGDGYEASWHFNDPLRIIGGSQYNGLARSTDGGFSWSSATNGLTNTGSGSAPFITKIAKTNMVPDLLFAVGSSGVFRSTDFGANWNLTAIPSGTWGAISSFHDIRISRANPDIVWGGARMDASGKIHVSTDRGLTFAATPVYSVTTMGGISGLSTHPTEDSTAFVLFSFAQKPKVLRTTDLGQTWTDISGFGAGTVSTNGFPDVAVYDLLVMPHAPDTIWAATEIGLFESTNAGGSWQYANNGLPAVAIWNMTHVEDEVVLGTHGRGIWSVTIPGLSAGQTFGPLVKSLSQGPDGDLRIGIGLRSPSDSTVITVNNARYANIGPNAGPGDTLVLWPVAASGAVPVLATSFKNGAAYPSVVTLVNVILFAPAQPSYVSTFNAGPGDISGSGFSITAAAGFGSNAVHSVHPYSNTQTLTTTLTVPVIVAASNAFFAYDDVALMEPGEPGSVFGDPSFYDYVVVEGSTDGATWIPLADGYDAGYDPVWLTAFNLGTPGDSTMYRHHEVNLLNTFSAGQTILVRFRLFADPGVTGWGWAIDNLEIQDRIGTVTTYNITATSGPHGTVTPSGLIIVPQGTDTLFTFTPDPGYRVDSVFVDGAYAGNDSTFVFASVTAPHTLYVTFAFDAVSVAVAAGWNLVSNPVVTATDSAHLLFPASASHAYSFDPSGGYQTTPTFFNGGGYWLKFSSAGVTPFTGTPIDSITIPVAGGWNIIGSITSAVDTAQIIEDPPGIVSSLYYAYQGGYAGAAAVSPGAAYWVRVSQNGTLKLGGLTAAKPEAGEVSHSVLAGLSTLVVTDAKGRRQELYFGRGGAELRVERFTMPPVPPEGAFDARFGTQSMLALAAGYSCDVPIILSSAAFPVTVSWRRGSDTVRAMLIISGRSVNLRGEGGTVVTPEGASIRLAMLNDGEVPTAFQLHQNHPNPFNPATRIRYDLPQAARVQLTVYDITGREVARLVNEEQPAGAYSIQWDATGLSSGVYFCRMQAGSFAATRKLLLLR